MNVIASNNISIGKVNKFTEHDTEKNLKLFKIIESQREKMKSGVLPQGIAPSSIIDYSPFNSYNAQDVVERGQKIKSATKDGWVYYADTETLGNPVSMNKPGTSPELNKLNNDIFTVNEVAMLKQQFKDGKPVGEPIKVLDFTSTRTAEEMRVFASSIKDRADVDSTSLSTLKRFAGYDNKKVGRVRQESFVAGKVKSFNNEANIMDENIIAGGIRNLSENAQYTVGTEAYNDKVREIYNEFVQIAESDNSIIATMNGDAFDMKVFFGMFETAGIDISDEMVEKISGGHVDMQKMMTSLIRDDIFEGQNKRVTQLIEEGNALTKAGKIEEAAKVYEEAKGIKHNMTNSNVIQAANGYGSNIKLENAHVAYDDTLGTAKATNAFMPNLIDKIDQVEAELETNRVGQSTKTSYNAVNAISAQEGDIFFSKEFNSPNSYNPVLMEAGHSYSIQSFTLDDNVELPKEFKDMSDLIKGKKMVKFTDLSDKVDRESWLVLNSDEEIQKRILNSGNIIPTKMNSSTQQIINETTEAALIDKARVERSNFYKVNSDKGFSSFEMYQDTFNEYKKGFDNPTLKHLEAAVENGGVFSNFGDQYDVNVNDALPSLKSFGEEGTYINERLRNVISLYDDFDQNSDTYGRLRNSVNSIVGDHNSVASRYNLSSNSRAVAPISKRAKTSTFASMKKGLEDRIYEDLSEGEILEHYIKSNDGMLEAFNDKVLGAKKVRAKRNNTTHNKVKLTDEELTGMRKEVFSKFNGGKFDKSSDEVKDFVFGFKEISDNYKNVDGLDILTRDGDYTRIQMNDKAKFSEGLNKAVYKNTAANKKGPANNLVRENYLRDVAKDLLERNIIDQETLSKMNEANTVASKISILGNKVYSNKDEAYALIRKANGFKDAENAIINGAIDYSKLSKKERKSVKKFIAGQKRNVIKNQPNGMTVMDKSFDKFIDGKYGAGKDELFNSVSRSASSAFPNVITLTGDITNSASKDVIKGNMKKVMMDNYNWSESNFENFFEKVINNGSNTTFKYSNGTEVAGGVASHIVDIDGSGYLISVSKDKEKRIIDSLIDGADLEDIKKNAAVFALPKVEEVNGIRAIKQSEKSYKAITNNLTLKKTKRVYNRALDIDMEDIAVYDFEDTVDEVINKLSSNLKYSKSHMENRNFEKANSTLNGAWRAIHEDKTLNAVSAKAVPDGKGGHVIKKVLGVNRSDYALNTMTDVSDLVYSLDSVLTDNKELMESFDAAHGGPSARNSLVAKIKNHKADWYSKGEKLTFEGLELSTKTWFTDNIKPLSETILDNKYIMSNSNTEFNRFLTEMSNVGIKGFYTKESGETARGFYNTLSPDKLNAGSLYSGVSRPLINQTLSATDIGQESMLLLAKDRLPSEMMNGIETADDLMNKIGIKKSISYMTTEGTKVAELANNLEGKSMIGMSTSVKYMSPDEFLENINGLKNMSDDSEIAKQIATNLKNRGINASSDDIKRAATAIGDVTNLYEDSGAVNPVLASLMSPKTVVEQKIEMSNKGFKVGSTLKNGTVIGHKNGKPIKYKGQNAKIVNSESGLLTLQLNQKYIDFKAGLGGSEKLELHAASFKNKKELTILDEVFKSISGGANIIANPSIGKHESFNTIITSYTNAMTNNMKSIEDVKYVNSVFAKHMPGQEMKMKKVAGRWSLVEGARDPEAKFNALESFENVINEIKNGDSEYSKSFANDVSRLEKDRISFMDIFTMQDNTIEKSQFETNSGRGASLNHRSQSVMGMFIGDEDNIVDLEKYRDIKNGKYVSTWDAVIKSDIEQMMNDPKFVRGMEQSHNIRSSIGLSIGEAGENLNVVNMSLNDALAGSSVMTASDIPQAFKFTKDGERVHAYKINLAEHNVEIKNPIYEKLREELGEGAETAINKFNIKETVSEIFIPALDSNWLDEKYMLTDIQKKSADLLSSIHDFSNGIQNGKTNAQKIAGINKMYGEYLDSLRKEVTDKDGLYKSSMHVKSLFSSRQKVAKIAAPVVDSDGTYKDLTYKAKSTKLDVNGKLKHYGTVELNPEDILGATGKELEGRFGKIGKQLLDENIDESEEALKAFKKVFGNRLDNAKDMKGAKEILKGADISKKEFQKLGQTFLEDVGIHSAIMRDPAMLSTSYQSVKVFANKNVTSGTVNMDSITALLMNADGDGDEINMFFHAFKKDKNGFKLRDANDDVIKSLKNTYETNADFNSKKFKGLINSFAEKEVSKDATLHAVSEYKDYIEKTKAEMFEELGENGEHILNIDYMTGKTRYAGILSRTTKKTIGQISNPNYYLKSAASHYFSNKIGDVEALRSYKNIIDFTNFTEQSLIDVKSIKSIEEARAMADLASSYRPSMDNMGYLGKSNTAGAGRRYNAVRDMYKNLLYSTEGENSQYLLGFGRELLEKDMEEEVSKATSRILSGKTIKGTPGKATLEEALGDVYNLLQDKEANDVFFSTFVRQSDIGYASKGKLDTLQKMRRAAGLDENNSTGGRDIFEMTSDDRFLFSNAVVKGHDGQMMVANKGDILFKSNAKGQYDAGVFKVESTHFKDGMATMKMTDINTGENINISGKGFNNISEQMSDFKKFNKEGQFKDLNVELPDMAEYDEEKVIATLNKVTSDSLYKDYSKAYLNDLGDLNNATMNIENINKNSIKYKASKRALDEINIENAKDAMSTAKILVEKKMITEDESTLFIKSMNDAIKKKGTKSYREQKKAKLLNIKSLTEKYKVSGSSLDSFLNEHVTAEAIKATTSSASISSAKKKLEGIKRYDLDSTSKNLSNKLNGIIEGVEEFSSVDSVIMSGAKKKVFDDTMTEVRRLDSEALKTFQNVYSENASNLQFQKEVLGWDFDKIDDLIKNNKTSDAMSTINASKIAHGKYAGYSLGNLDSTQVKEILDISYSEASVGNIDNAVFTKTREMIEKMQNLEKGGTIRNVKPLSSYDDFASTKAGSDFIGSLREGMNENIKKRGKEAGSKFNKNTGKSIIDQMADSWKGMGTKGKIVTGAMAAVAAAGIVSFAYGGNGSIEDKSGEYVRKSSGKKYDPSEPVTSNSGGGYSSVPTSDTSYYENQNNGVNVTVKGRPPRNSSPRDAGDTLGRALGGSVNINSTYSDSRKPIDDREIDDIMSNATY